MSDASQTVEPGAPTDASTRSGGGLLKAARTGAIVSMLGFGTAQVLRLCSNLIMTRLLAPEAFGLVGVSLTLTYIVGMLSDIGIATSIVRSARGEEPRWLRTAWTMAIIRGVLIYAVIASLIGLLVVFRDEVPPDSVFANPILPSFALLSALSVVISGLDSPNFILAQRKLRLGSVVTVELGSQVLSIVVMVVAALLGAGPWSLVVGVLVSASGKMLGTHLIVPGSTMALTWDREAFSEIFHFGKWLLLASFCTALALRGDQFVFGYLFDEELFALYVIAGIWVTAVLGLGQTVSSRVVYPAISTAMRERPNELADTYYRLRLVAELSAVFCVVALWIGIGPFFELFYRESYQGAVFFVRLLAVGLLVFPSSFLGSVILSQGDSRRFALVQIVPSLVIFGVVPWVHQAFGPTAAVLTFAVSQVFTLPALWVVASGSMPLRIWPELRMLLALAVGTTIAYSFAGSMPPGS